MPGHFVNEILLLRLEVLETLEKKLISPLLLVLRRHEGKLFVDPDACY